MKNSEDKIKKRKYDLQERLIDFAVLILGLAEDLPKTSAGRHLAGQIERSGTSPALHYGEAQSAESRKDFIHKVKVILKELRETYACLNIIDKAGHLGKSDKLSRALPENNELISIFVTSLKTARKNQNAFTS